VSADPPGTHRKWAARRRFPYPLLSDEGKGTLRLWGAWGRKSLLGLKYEGMTRCTFLLDATGRVARAWPRVNPIGHARAVLAAVRA